jgi:prepilin-type processing-associated H-X9-DG protein/prepilin-type N-terminal cleavage/methylation domain-containing protein
MGPTLTFDDAGPEMTAKGAAMRAVRDALVQIDADKRLQTCCAVTDTNGLRVLGQRNISSRGKRNRSPRPIHGFTPIEILIVIAIIGLLISLSVPAIQASREASRRAQCMNNQRQFGVAFSNFESQRRVFPAAFSMRMTGPLGAASFQAYSVFAELLPFIEESGVADQYDYDAFFCAPQNQSAIATVIHIAVCPTTPRQELAPVNNFVPSQWAEGSLVKDFGKVIIAFDKKYSATFRGAITDYSVPVRAEKRLALALGYDIPKNSNTELRSVFPLPDTDKLVKQLAPLLFSSGSVAVGERTRAAQITDGLSKTFLLTEDAGRPEHWQRGVRSYVREPLMSAWADPLIGIFIRDPDSKTGRCIINCDNESNIYSFHPGGVNFLFADGHVTFLGDDIDPKLLLAYMSPDKADNDQ